MFSGKSPEKTGGAHPDWDWAADYYQARRELYLAAAQAGVTTAEFREVVVLYRAGRSRAVPADYLELRVTWGTAHAEVMQAATGAFYWPDYFASRGRGDSHHEALEESSYQWIDDD